MSSITVGIVELDRGAGALDADENVTTPTRVTSVLRRQQAAVSLAVRTTASLQP
jgi:hypothetical protein